MEKYIECVIEKIIQIAHLYNKKGNVTINALIKESGYPSMSDQITETEIEAFLRRSPNLINEWLIWSEFKPAYPTWRFWKEDDGNYFVEYPTTGKELGNIVTTDKFKACAAFIKRELENFK